MEALMIGVSGMRGTVGGTLTPPVVGRMAAAFAVFLKSNQAEPSKPLRVVFGRDSRPSGSWVRDAAIGTLAASGIEVTDLDIVTTPGVAMMVKQLSADAGVIATASHNPIEWNGLKFLNAACVAPPPADAIKIRQIYDESLNQFRSRRESSFCTDQGQSDPRPAREESARTGRQPRHQHQTI